MKAQDLRIGNWIHNETLQTDVKVYPMLIYQLSNLTSESNFKPIPLTEEWLVKFGFEKKKVPGSVNKFYYIKNKFYYCIHDHNPVVFSNSALDGIFLEEVHQLQNLYCALTGEELTLKK